jgi:hypothetical protein
MISALSFHFGGPFLTVLPFKNDRTPVWVIQWKESLMTIKKSDFLAVLQPKCIRVIHIFWTIQSTDKFVICKIIID